MTLTGRLRARRYRKAIDEVRRSYENAGSAAQRASWRLDALNGAWAGTIATVPFYRSLHARGAVPARFGSVEEFAERVPSVGRADVQRHREAMTSEARPSELVRMTGGSTAEPVQMPAWKSEYTALRPDLWLGRSWYGVGPDSRLFLLWGHSHLLGTGMKGRLRRYRVSVGDRLLGYRRFSAYDLRPERLEEAARALIAARPEYMIGYSVALDLFARSATAFRRELRELRLKVVVGTSERFPFPDSAARLEDLFGSPVGMEYGAVETLLMAHTRPGAGFSVFWRTYFVEAQPYETGHRLFVTSLYPRSFPLVRYDMGDEIVVGGEASGPVLGLEEFARVIGRCNEYVSLEDGSIIHSEVFTHAVRPCSSIGAYQIAQVGGEVLVRYVADADLSAQQVEEIRGRLARAHAGLAGARIERVLELDRTIAGKTPMVVRKAPGAVAPPGRTTAGTR